jgi:hypothetical protein
MESVKSKLKHQKGAIPKPGEEASSESEVSVSDELTAAKTLQAIDEAAYNIHFVLQQLGTRADLADLFTPDISSDKI